MYEPDAELGWRNKEGAYTVPPYTRSGAAISYTFLNHGRRATSHQESDAQREVVIVGGSFTQGWAISDSETYPWKLQEKLSLAKVLNFGTGGYGTYQSLLTLERELPLMKSPVLVVYGFFNHHEVRNVADPEWLRILSTFEKRAHVYLPYATLDEHEALARHAPERYLALPFRERSALIAFLEERYMWIAGHWRVAQQRAVTARVIVEMNRLSEKFGAKFVTVLLNAPDDTALYYKDRLEKDHVRVIDCNFPLTDEMRVLGEGHPNGRMHSLWAQCIQATLGEQLS